MGGIESLDRKGLDYELVLERERYHDFYRESILLVSDVGIKVLKQELKPKRPTRSNHAVMYYIEMENVPMEKLDGKITFRNGKVLEKVSVYDKNKVPATIRWELEL